VHLDGLEGDHDRAVNQKGVFKIATRAIAKARDAGFRVNVNCTLFDNAKAEEVSAFFDYGMPLGVEGITVSPGYAYERAPDQAHFLSRQKTKQLFRDIFRRGKGKKWALQPVDAVSRFPRGQSGIQVYAMGKPDPQRIRLAAALLSAG